MKIVTNVEPGGHLWHPGTLAVLVLVTTDMVGSKICSLRSTSIFSLPHLVYNVNVYFQRFLQTMFSHLWYPVHPHPHPIIARSLRSAELEWCSLKPQNLRVLSQLQSCWRLIELTSHCWTSCLYRIKSHSHLGTYIITGNRPIPLRGSFRQQAISYSGKKGMGVGRPTGLAHIWLC